MKKYKAPSTLALYRQLHDQGFPVCEACGAYCSRSTLCENCTAKRKPKRGGDEGIELPPPSSAIDLFAPVVDSLDLVELTTLADDVLEGNVDRADAAVAGQLLNTVIRAIGMEMRVREVEDLAREVEELRDLVEAGRSQGQRSYGA